MTSPHINVLDVIDGQRQQEAARNQQIADFDPSMNRRTTVTVNGSLQLTEVQQKRRRVVLLNPGSVAADFTVDMFDTNQRMQIFVNNTDFIATLRNSAGSIGDTLVALAPGDKSWVYYDGTNFIELARTFGFQPIELVAFTTAATTGLQTSLVVNKPAGVQEGDYLLAALAHGSDSTVGAGLSTLTDPSGFAGVIGAGIGSGTFDYAMEHRFRAKFAGASEPADYTWSWTPAELGTIALMAFRNVDAIDPIDDTRTDTGINTSGNQCDLATLTTALNNEVLVFGQIIRTLATSRTVNTSPTNYVPMFTPVHNIGGASNRASNRLAVGTRDFPEAGATGTQSFTYTGSITSPAYAACMIALQPIH